MRALAFGLVLGVLLIGASSEAKEDTKAVLESVSKYGACVIGSTYSFLYPSSYPPKTSEEFRRLCRTQADNIKCVKEKSKGGAPILRRGMVTYMGVRQRHHRKYCTNPESEQSRRMLEATRCLMEKRFSAFRAIDAEIAQTFIEIARRNYDDPAQELKQLCCTFHTYKKSFSAAIGRECLEHKPMIEELGGQIVAEDLSLVCDDDEKLAKLCPTLEPLNFKRVANFTPQENESPAVMGLYLFATLGEPAS